jgi:hypothetical protein
VLRIHWTSEQCNPLADDIDWNAFFTKSKQDFHPLRAFFLRHRTIEDLALGWSPKLSYTGRINPDEMSQIFPSLKRFEGPGFLCNAITKSDVAQRLEHLILVDLRFEREANWLNAMGDSPRHMPKLRWLEIQARGSSLDPVALGRVIEAAPNIETFDCGLTVHDFVSPIDLCSR